MSSASWHRLLYTGLLLFGLCLPLSKSASNILLGALYAAAAAGVLLDRQFRADFVRSCRQPLTAALGFFCLVAYLGIIHTQRPADGFAIANKFVSLPAIYFLVSVLLQADPRAAERTRKAESLLVSFLIGLAALNLLGVMTYLGVIGEREFALPLAPLDLHHIWFSNINALGLYAGVFFLLFNGPGASTRTKVYLSGFLLLSALCIVLSTSRTAWFSISLTAAIMAFALIRSRKTVFLIMGCSALLFASAYQFVPLVRDRIDTIPQDLELFFVSEKKPSSIGSRLLMWKASLKMFRSRPLLGVGTGDYLRTIEEYRELRLLPRHLLDYNQPHNMYLFTLATNGIVGLSALLFIFFRSLRSTVPVVRSSGNGKLLASLAMATAVHFMIAGFMDSFFNIQILRYSFAFIMGVCIRSSVSDAEPAAANRAERAGNAVRLFARSSEDDRQQTKGENPEKILVHLGDPVDPD